MALLIGLTATTIFLLGCLNRTVITTIRHPLQTGQVDPNTVPHTYANQENNYALPPGTLNDEASLVQMDSSAACFDVTLNFIDDGEGQSWTDLRNWEITLDANPGDIRIVQPTVELYEPSAQQFQGQAPQEVEVGRSEECVKRDRNDRCTRWENRPIYETQWLPAIITVVTGGGRICFGNGGHVTTNTTSVKLNLHRPGRTVAFEWEFEPILAAQPATQGGNTDQGDATQGS